jgi:hypothetical protein
VLALSLPTSKKSATQKIKILEKIKDVFLYIHKGNCKILALR